MIKKNIWLNWDEMVHDSPEQQARQQAAKSVSYPQEIDMYIVQEDSLQLGKPVKEYVNYACKFHMPEPYCDIETTLKDCTCADFRKRRLPCKHMYRLAMLIGAF